MANQGSIEPQVSHYGEAPFSISRTKGGLKAALSPALNQTFPCIVFPEEGGLKGRRKPEEDSFEPFKAFSGRCTLFPLAFTRDRERRRFWAAPYSGRTFASPSGIFWM